MLFKSDRAPWEMFHVMKRVSTFFLLCVCYGCLCYEPEAHLKKWVETNEPQRFLTKENTEHHGILFLPEAR